MQKRLSPYFAALIVLGWASCCLAAPKGVAYTDPEKAGEDFKFQGEYAGMVETEDGYGKFGAQVIALGKGRFRAVGYPGGLPGDGWRKIDGTRSGEGKLEDGIVEFYVDEATATLKDGVLTVVHDGTTVGTMRRVKRVSPTLGAKPPQDATVLFDGTSLKNFEDAAMFGDDLLKATDCSSRQLLGDHHLHIEFRTPFMPESSGQARGNSGVYVQSRYEVQVLDSFGLEGRDNECGGIYKVSSPAVNMCSPPLSWQTYDIDFTAACYENGAKVKNARITVEHNGVVIHDDIELPEHTPGRWDEAPEPAPLYLQDHGNPVVFRNIWVTGDVTRRRLQGPSE